MGRKLHLRKPRNPFPRLLGLAYKAPASCQWCFTTLIFNLFGNHCCRNKPMDALVSHTLLYCCRVTGGRLLLAPLPSISFATQNWSNTFWLISHWVTALRPFVLRAVYYSSLCQLLRALLLSWYVREGKYN